MSFNRTLAVDLARTIDGIYAGQISTGIVDHATDTQVRIEHVGGNRYYLAFPGTASLRDWMTDLKIRKTEWASDGSKAHRGFVSAWRSVVGKILASLPRGAELVISGHSLGGALATLAADVLNDCGYRIAGVYTFGSPRVFNHTAANSYSDRLARVTYRVTNQGDPIPSVPWPLRTFTSGIYWHVACEHALKKSGELVIEPWGVTRAEEFAKAQTPACEVELQHATTPASALPKTGEHVTGLLGFDLDHPLTSYIKRLEALR